MTTTVRWQIFFPAVPPKPRRLMAVIVEADRATAEKRAHAR